MSGIHEFSAYFREFYSHHIVFSTGLLLIAGYSAGKIAEKARLPSITGYILAGLILGESLLHLVPEHAAVQLNSITEIALGLIAITIGAEFDFKRLRRTGRTILIITVTQALFAFTAVVLGMALFRLPLPHLLILGAIATATAPAATVVIVKQLRLRGEFVDYLYGIVAIDDALCVLVFSIIFAMVGPMIAQTAPSLDASMLIALMHALGEIALSCLLGFVAGFILHVATHRKHRLNEILVISIAAIFLTISLAVILHLSLLIANMALGAILINVSSRNKRIFAVLEPVTPPIFALFFVLAGTELDLGVFSEGIVVAYGAVYVVARFAGKYAGTYVSAAITRTSKGIRNYLGFCLFPQAGVAIGLALFLQSAPMFAGASEQVKDMLVLMVNVVLLSIFVNELVGPIISRYGIVKGMELDE